MDRTVLIRRLEMMRDWDGSLTRKEAQVTLAEGLLLALAKLESLEQSMGTPSKDGQPTTASPTKDSPSDAVDWRLLKSDLTTLEPQRARMAVMRMALILEEMASTTARTSQSSLQPGDQMVADLFHAASCSECAEALGVFLARCRTHALDVAGRSSTSQNEASDLLAGRE